LTLAIRGIHTPQPLSNLDDKRAERDGEQPGCHSVHLARSERHDEGRFYCATSRPETPQANKGGFSDDAA
jgi:hypothetical protein